MIGVSIIYHPRVDKYLDTVIKNYRIWEVVHISQHNFEFEKEEKARNSNLEALKNCDFVFIVDADEIILPMEQVELVRRMKAKDSDVGFCPVINYTRDFKHRYKPNGHQPVVIVKPNKVSFYDDRCLRFGEALYANDIFVHHLGFTFDKKTMDWKKENYRDEKNPNEIEKIMSGEVEPFAPPEELKEVLG